jgi:hypothetical protein
MDFFGEIEMLSELGSGAGSVLGCLGVLEREGIEKL